MYISRKRNKRPVDSRIELDGEDGGDGQKRANYISKREEYLFLPLSDIMRA